MADGRVGNKVKYNILLLYHTKESVVYSTEEDKWDVIKIKICEIMG